MAQERLTERKQLIPAEASENLVFYVVDKNDVSEHPEGSSFQVSREDLITILGVGSPLFIGEFTSLANLRLAHPTGTSGNYAHIDEGVGHDVRRALWDNTDNIWVLGSIVPGGSSFPVLKTGNNIVFTEEAEYYADISKNPIISGNLTLNATGAVPGVGVAIKIWDYTPLITGAPYIIDGDTGNGKRDIYHFYYGHDGIKLNIIGEGVLTTPVLALTPGDTVINVAWSSSTGVGSYVLRRNTSNTPVGATVIYTGPLLNYNDTGLTNNVDYYYFIQATNGVGVYDSDLGTATAKPLPYPSTAFVLTIKTDNAGSSATDQFTMPLFQNTGGQKSAYNFTVRYGGAIIKTVTTYTDATIIFPDGPGTKKIIIEGVFKGWSFRNLGDKLKLINIEQFGTMSFGNHASGGYLKGCENLTITATDSPNTVDTINCTEFFTDCKAIVTIPTINSWGLKPSSMLSMFMNMTLFNQSNLNGIDTSISTSFRNIFYGSPVINPDISSWSGASCTSVQNFAFNAFAFNQSIGHLVLQSCTSFENMVYGVGAFNQSLGGLKPFAPTGNVTFFSSGAKISAANLDDTYIQWAAYPANSIAKVRFDFGTSKRTSASDAAKAQLESEGVTFLDGGYV